MYVCMYVCMYIYIMHMLSVGVVSPQPVHRAPGPNRISNDPARIKPESVTIYSPRPGLTVPLLIPLGFHAASTSRCNLHLTLVDDR
jgi:hypothetical protein